MKLYTEEQVNELRRALRDIAQWDDVLEDDFQPCDNCDLQDACADFGCAIKTGVRKSVEW